MVILESKKDIQKPCECLINLEQNNIKKQKFINLLLNENTQELKKFNQVNYYVLIYNRV